jgi:hypothetical protein
MNWYESEELFVVSGGVCTFEVGADGPDATVMSFGLEGALSVISGTINYALGTFQGASVVPSSNTSSSITVGGYTGVVRSWKYTENQEYVNRVDQNGSLSPGSAGYAEGDSKPVLEVTMEEPPITSIDYFNAWHSGSLLNVSVQTGTEANNRFRYEWNNCQLRGLKRTRDGKLALLELTLEPHESSNQANDAMVIRALA